MLHNFLSIILELILTASALALGTKLKTVEIAVNTARRTELSIGNFLIFIITVPEIRILVELNPWQFNRRKSVQPGEWKMNCPKCCPSKQSSNI
jgi:hypothetical protein